MDIERNAPGIFRPQVFLPESQAEIERIVAEHHAEGKPLRPVVEDTHTQTQHTHTSTHGQALNSRGLSRCAQPMHLHDIDRDRRFPRMALLSAKVNTQTHTLREKLHIPFSPP